MPGDGVCWYRFSVYNSDDNLIETELNKVNYMQVYVHSLSEVYMYIASSASSDVK